MTETPVRLVAALADRYRIERELGQGGMATVYLAEDLKHKRKVALKVLRPELAAMLGAERFVQEITTTAALQHPHILSLFDSGTADGFLYYVMPYIEGETLRAKLDRETQLGVDEAVRLAREVADALDYAHRHGVIHRDIKPENILLHDGRPMVADFGIALALSAAAGGRMTETGMSLGTPHYMSPEQATAEKEITARSDVYSLGSVLYEMLAGQPPHLGGSAQQIIMKIIAEPVPPVTTLRKSVPPNVAAALAKALEKLPADRFDSAKAFAEALGNPAFTAAMTGHTGSRTALPPYRPAAVLVLAAALVAMSLVAGWALKRHAPPSPVIRYALALPREQAPTEGGFVLISPDGSHIVYAGPSEQPGGSMLWVKQRDHLNATPLAGTEGASAAAISPDGASIVVVQGDLLRKLPITGGTVVKLAEGASNGPGSVAWLEHGIILYVARDFRIMRVPEGGGAGTVVWTPHSVALSHLTPLPDGRGVLLQACPAPCNQSAVWALDLRADSAHLVVPDARAGYYVPSHQLVFVRNDQNVLAAPFDLSSLQIRGASVAVLDSVLFEYSVYPYFAVSPTGTVVMRVGDDPSSRLFTLVWVDRAGRESLVDSSWTFRITRFAANHGWALSPDGTKLAIGLNTPAGDDIWIKPLPHGAASRVTYDSLSESRPRWRADGRSVTYISTTGLHQRRADGTGPDSLLWGGLIDEGFVSPDGRWLVFRRGATGAAAGGRDILGVRIGVDTVPEPLVETPYDEMAPVLSPDGHWLAYQSDETGRVEVFVRPFPNTGDQKVQVSSDGGAGAVWARNGHELFYLRRGGTMMAVPVTPGPPIRLGEPHALFRLPESLTVVNDLYYSPWDVAADGRFIMVRTVDTGPHAARPLIVVENWLEELKGKVQR